LVTVRVKVVVEAGETTYPEPEVTAPTPLSMLPVPLENVGVIVTLDPAVMVVEVEVRELATGIA
jgi:hypothetical protein